MWKSLFIAAAGLFVIMVISQAMIITGNPVLSVYNELQPESGIDMSSRQLGEVTLSLIDIEPTPDIKILINGNIAALFTSRRINIVVGDNSLIEIDGREVSKPFSVEIINKSKNAVLKNNKQFTYVDGNVNVLSQVYIN